MSEGKKKKKFLHKEKSIVGPDRTSASYCLLLMGVKGSVREALAVVLPKEFAVTQADVVNLVP